MPRLIKFHHRGKLLLSIRGDDGKTALIEATEESYKGLAFALDVPLNFRVVDAPSTQTPLEATVSVQQEIDFSPALFVTIPTEVDGKPQWMES
mgnify:CR=1 FL=1